METSPGSGQILRLTIVLLAGCATLSLAACSSGGITQLVGTAPVARPAPTASVARSAAPLVTVSAYAPRATSGRAELDGLINRYAALYGIPAELVHRVVRKESTYNPRARNGPYYGLMQISHATASTMGYRGAPEGLLDAETNLRYAVKYLAGAYLVANNSQDGAIRLYQRGYYYDAKRRGLLEEAGLR